MSATLAGKSALVTGANRGIGRAIARGLAAAGASVTLAGRTLASLQEASVEIAVLGGRAFPAVADVTDEAAVERLFALHVEQFGGLDVLVNNAGAFDGGPFDELTAEAWDKVIAVNLRGPFLCGRAAFRLMKASGRGGRILNLGSISAQRPRANSAPYATSKFGVQGLTHAMALDGRPYKIAVSCLHPGNVLSERRVNDPQDREPMMTVDELADVAVHMCGLPPHVNMLEAIVLPIDQEYLGRG
ncbi:MAG TPA: SDR family oxidoreductase [Pirellulales bacterium]